MVKLPACPSSVCPEQLIERASEGAGEWRTGERAGERSPSPSVAAAVHIHPTVKCKVSARLHGGNTFRPATLNTLGTEPACNVSSVIEARSPR